MTVGMLMTVIVVVVVTVIIAVIMTMGLMLTMTRGVVMSSIVPIVEMMIWDFLGCLRFSSDGIPRTRSTQINLS